ncbi:unnamed protein product [marine sediment metagenome]|uniref:HNH domain-containing protein n=1 Tax=marine sediment metagenome TaxID=412755 RepID=X1GXQ4_9ZZZZ
MKVKFCPKCKRERDISEFVKNKNRKDNLDCWCKKCKKLYNKQHYKKTKKEREENNLRWRKENPKRAWVTYVLSSHKRRGHIINITNDELLEMIKNIECCSFCNCKLSWGYGNGFTNNSPTLDRIDNKKNISLGNIQILCRRCNVTKFDRNMKEFIEYCKMIYKKFGGDNNAGNH